jgi:hypothetical protein
MYGPIGDISLTKISSQLVPGGVEIETIVVFASFDMRASYLSIISDRRLYVKG